MKSTVLKAVIFLLIVISLGATLEIGSFTVSASTSPATFTPTADAYVDSSKQTKNFGTLTTLRTDGSPVVNSYVIFNVQGISGTVSNATLRVFANSGSSTGYSVQSVSDTSWGETTITFANAPAMGGSAGSSGSFNSNLWTSVNVTSLVSGNGLVSFALTSSNSTAVSYASLESGANAPQLVVTFSGGSTATNTPNPTPTSSAVFTSTPTPTRTATLSVTLTPTPTSIFTSSPTPTSASTDPVILAAGDIASCNSSGDSKTAALINANPNAVVLTMGDNAYPDGAPTDFSNCYNPTWGAFLNRTHPSIGNHEYLTTNASGYFGYFGAAAGDPTKGYYSFNLGDWHIIAINSNCSKVGGCSSGTPQESWLKADLAANHNICTLAYWHHPRFSSGQNGSFTSMQPIWQDLYNAGAEIVLNGHDHDYERFAPQTPTGGLDNAQGIQEIVAGTGGSNNTPFVTTLPNSLVQNATSFGVLKLTLHPTSYDWQYVPIAGQTFTDSGSATCH